ncbi:MAG: TonB-dependent receptor [Lentisphaeraceae bacterium]|nr:TonB-dependent receptor [Lentisphaeraceae bacterium]
MEDKLSTMQKALAINLDSNIYGTIAEIGAGQEVARFFFQAGGAAGTIAKTMSAYDMIVSDSIYGEESNGRYVSRSRVEKMLDREYPLLVERVADNRQKTSQYFAFSNTVAAQGYKTKRECHGWLGIKLQLYPGAEPSTIVLHVRMLDSENRQQQEALGILGVNLIYGGVKHFQSPEVLLTSLVENLGPQRIEIDYANLSGPYFDDVDNRIIALYMVKAGLTTGAMLSTTKDIILPSEALYKKNILVARGKFKPVTLVNEDMENCAREQFMKEKGVREDNTIFLAELSMAEMMTEGQIDLQDFLDRADILCDLGYNVIISNYLRFFTLRAYLTRMTKKQIGIVLSVPNIIDIFNEDFYDGIEGGILESFGKLFAFGTKLYVYPRKCLETGELITTKTLKVPVHLKNLYLYLLENNLIVPLKNGNEDVMGIYSKNVLESLQFGPGQWETQVPELVRDIIKQKRLFGYDSK